MAKTMLVLLYLLLLVLLFALLKTPSSLDSLVCPEPSQVTGNETSTTKTAFIGIMTTSQRFHRRSLIRATYLSACPPDITVKFVIARPSSQQDADLLALENLRFNDILLLGIPSPLPIYH